MWETNKPWNAAARPLLELDALLTRPFTSPFLTRVSSLTCSKSPRFLTFTLCFSRLWPPKGFRYFAAQKFEAETSPGKNSPEFPRGYRGNRISSFIPFVTKQLFEIKECKERVETPVTGFANWVSFFFSSSGEEQGCSLF